MPMEAARPSIQAREEVPTLDNDVNCVWFVHVCVGQPKPEIQFWSLNGLLPRLRWTPYVIPNVAPARLLNSRFIEERSLCTDPVISDLSKHRLAQRIEETVIVFSGTFSGGLKGSSSVANQKRRPPCAMLQSAYPETAFAIRAISCPGSLWTICYF